MTQQRRYPEMEAIDMIANRLCRKHQNETARYKAIEMWFHLSANPPKFVAKTNDSGGKNIRIPLHYFDKAKK